MALQIQKNGETITLRNLQEQVQKNKEDIANHYAIDRTLANLGIAIVGQVETADQLPDPATYKGEYGDTYAVGSEQDVAAGTASFEFYIYTRPDLDAGHPENYWLNVGKISIIGPQGPEGPIGPKGDTGESSRWYAADNLPTSVNYNLGDMWLITSGQSKGNVLYYNGTQWIGITNIIGPQGIQGPQGFQGVQGPQGIQGPKGDTGDVGGFINVWGILENTSQLPTPVSLNNLTVAYLVGSSSPYDLYIQAGKTPTDALWTNTGPFNVGTLVRIAGVAQNVLDLDTYLSNNVYNKSEIDTKLSSKADSSNVYTKTQVDTKLSTKADKSDTYTRAAIDSMILTFSTDKADKSDTYTKQEINEKIYQAILGLNIEFEKGTIHANGTNDDNEPYIHTRCRTADYIYLKKGQILKFNHIYKYDYNIMEFDTNKNIISDDGWTSNAYWIAPQDMYVRIVLKKSDNYLNLINRAIGYYHRNDIYENVSTRIIFDLKDINVGDTITINDNTGQRFALTVFDKPYGSSYQQYLYDSGWVSSGTALTHTIESGAKCALIVWSMADNSDVTSKGWMLNPNISVRKTNDDYFLPSDLEEINNDSFYAGDTESLNIEKNRISNGIIQWAHRGYNEYAPENTIPSFEMAYKFGLRCMECDVRLTADNVPVILHDSTINRTARNLDGTAISGTVEVANLILPKLRNDYDFGIWFSNEYAGTKIPTFEELIMWCKSKDCYLHIDLLGGAITTTAQLQILYDIVLRHNMQDKVLWEVNAKSFIDWLKAKDANTEIIFNPYDTLTTNNIDTIVSYGLKKISTRVDTVYSVIEYANKKGLQVFLWSANPVSVSNDNIVKYYKYGASGFYTSLQTVDEYLKDYEYVLSQRKDL